MTFTKQQLDTLSAYEDRFRSSLYFDYYRNLSANSLERIADVYDEATGKKTQRNWSCGTCIMNYLREVGKIYFKDKEEYEKEAEKMVEILDEVFEVNEAEESEPKTTTPKASTTNKKTNTKKNGSK